MLSLAAIACDSIPDKLVPHFGTPRKRRPAPLRPTRLLECSNRRPSLLAEFDIQRQVAVVDLQHQEVEARQIMAAAG